MALVDNAWYVQGATNVAVTDLTSASNSAGATLTLSITVPAGALIVVIVSEVTSAAAGTMADATNGAYTLGTSGAMSGAAGFGMVFYFANSAALSAVTLTYTKQTSGRITSLSAFYATGIATTTPLDTAVTATTAVNSATPTVTGGVPTQPDLIVGACAYSNASARTLTNSGSFVVPFSTNSGQPTAQCGGGHINIGGAVATTFNPTLAAACDNLTMIVGFKPATNTLIGWWNVTKWTAGATIAAGALRRQNATPAVGSERVFVCIVAGTTHATTEPTWTLTRGAKTTDNTVTWQECTGIAAINGDATNTPSWTITATPPGGVKNTAVTQGQVIKRDSGASYQICTTTGTAGNGSEPSFSNTAGVTTNDNTVVWTSLGVVGNFTGWQAPHARIANAFASTWGQAGNAFFVAGNHAAVQTTTITWTSPGTLAAPCNIYAVDQTAGVPPGSGNLVTTASESMNVAGNFAGGGVGIFNGLIINYGSGAVTANLRPATNNYYWEFDNCALNSLGTGANGGPLMVGLGGTFWLKNTTVQFAAASGSIALNAGQFIWENTLSAIQGATLPTNLFGSSNAGFATALVRAVDLSALGSGKTLAQPGQNPIISFIDCKLGASVTVASVASATTPTVNLIRCDSGATNYRIERYQYQGTQTTETTIVRTGGASINGTPVSWKIITTANSRWISPFQCIPLQVSNLVTTSVTVTVYGIWGSASLPNNDDIWIEAEYLGSALTPQGTLINDTKVNNLATGTPLASDASTWGGSVGSNTKFKMTVTLTAGMTGQITVRVFAAKATTTFYIDPQPVLS